MLWNLQKNADNAININVYFFVAKQDKTVRRDNYQNRVLDLEKKYFNLILEVLRDGSFVDDLLLVEKDIRDNYRNYETVWNLKNKFKIPAERIIRHYVYTKLREIIRGVYPSPVSSDIGIKTDDAIICIDIKTIDTVGNSGDISSTSVEKNQTSFDNSNYRIVTIVPNLKPVDHYSDKPVLTYIVKLVYTDDGNSFKLCRNANYPSIVLCNIPNGKLSNLFGKNIIENFKTYSYYSVSDSQDFAPIKLTQQNKNNTSIVDALALEHGLVKCLNENNKTIYFDPRTNKNWWKVTSNKMAEIRAVKSGESMRFYNEILKERYDSQDQPWLGYMTLSIPDPI